MLDMVGRYAIFKAGTGFSVKKQARGCKVLVVSLFFWELPSDTACELLAKASWESRLMPGVRASSCAPWLGRQAILALTLTESFTATAHSVYNACKCALEQQSQGEAGLSLVSPMPAILLMIVVREQGDARPDIHTVQGASRHDNIR